MSWFDQGARALAGFAVTASLLAGCTVAPLHGERSAAGLGALPLAYAKPTTRLEQIAYRALAARIGTAPGDFSPVVTLAASTSASRVGLSTRPEPATDRQVVAIVTYRVERQGEVLASGSRTATSGYRTTGQILADDIARQNADEEAVRAAAESVATALLSDPALR